MANEQRPQIMVPDMCDRHARQFLQNLKIGPDGPWQSRLVIGNLMLFQASSADKGLQEQHGGDATKMTAILAKIGCLACFSHENFARVIKVMKKYPDMKDLGEIIHARKTDDPDWPFFAGKEIPPE